MSRSKRKGYKLQVIYLIGEMEKTVRLYYKWGEENKYRRKRKEGIITIRMFGNV